MLRIPLNLLLLICALASVTTAPAPTPEAFAEDSTTKSPYDVNTITYATESEILTTENDIEGSPLAKQSMILTENPDLDAEEIKSAAENKLVDIKAAEQIIEPTVVPTENILPENTTSVWSSTITQSELPKDNEIYGTITATDVIPNTENDGIVMITSLNDKTTTAPQLTSLSWQVLNGVQSWKKYEKSAESTTEPNIFETLETTTPEEYTTKETILELQNTTAPIFPDEDNTTTTTEVPVLVESTVTTVSTLQSTITITTEDTVSVSNKTTKAGNKTIEKPHKLRDFEYVLTTEATQQPQDMKMVQVQDVQTPLIETAIIGQNVTNIELDAATENPMVKEYKQNEQDKETIEFAEHKILDDLVALAAVAEMESVNMRQSRIEAAEIPTEIPQQLIATQTEFETLGVSIETTTPKISEITEQPEVTITVTVPTTDATQDLVEVKEISNESTEEYVLSAMSTQEFEKQAMPAILTEASNKNTTTEATESTTLFPTTTEEQQTDILEDEILEATTEPNMQTVFFTTTLKTTNEPTGTTINEAQHRIPTKANEESRAAAILLTTTVEPQTIIKSKTDTTILQETEETTTAESPQTKIVTTIAAEIQVTTTPQAEKLETQTILKDMEKTTTTQIPTTTTPQQAETTPVVAVTTSQTQITTAPQAQTTTTTVAETTTTQQTTTIPQTTTTPQPETITAPQTTTTPQTQTTTTPQAETTQIATTTTPQAQTTITPENPTMPLAETTPTIATTTPKIQTTTTPQAETTLIVTTTTPQYQTTTTSTTTPATTVASTTTTTTTTTSTTTPATTVATTTITTTTEQPETTTMIEVIPNPLVAIAPESRALRKPVAHIERIFNEDGVEVLYGYSSVQSYNKPNF